MERRKLAALVAAIAALALLVGAGAARCSVNMADELAGGPAAQAGQEAAAEGQADQEGSSRKGAESLWNTSWAGKDDPTATLSIADGVMVERAGGTERAIFFSPGDESEKDGVLTLEIEVEGEGGGLAILQAADSADGGRTLTCDLLSQAYVPQAAADAGFELAGADGRLAEALGASADDIRDALAAQAKRTSPYATRATWDKEVWIDYGEGRASATFTLNDTASTVMTVLVGAGGKIEVM